MAVIKFVMVFHVLELTTTGLVYKRSQQTLRDRCWSAWNMHALFSFDFLWFIYQNVSNSQEL
jgi:hypothetical protein